MKRTIFILLMLTGLALNLTKDGWGIIQTNTLSAQSWDGELYDGGIFSIILIGSGQEMNGFITMEIAMAITTLQI